MNLILLSTNVALFSLVLAFLASPKGSEWIGHLLVAHAEALRIRRALIKLANSEYKRAFREELHTRVNRNLTVEEAKNA